MGTPKKARKGKARKVYPRGAIIASKCRYRQTKAGKKVGAGPLPQKPGFVVQDASGNQFVLNDWPVGGGPWAPAWSSSANGGAGGFVWINQGGG